MKNTIAAANRQRQAQMLATLPEGERDFWARQHRIGNAAYSYQYQFNDVAGLNNDQPAKMPNVGPPEDLLEWLEQQLSARQESQSASELLKLYFEEYLEGLPNDRVREGERIRGLEETKRSWPFRRYVLERNDFGMDEFMSLNLSEEDYTYYKWSSEPL